MQKCTCTFRNRMSKLIRDRFGFASLSSLIGLKVSRHLLNQSDAKRKPTASWPLAFSRASRSLLVLTVSSDRLLVMFSFAVIGRCDSFGFGFTPLNRKGLNSIFCFCFNDREIRLNVTSHATWSSVFFGLSPVTVSWRREKTWETSSRASLQFLCLPAHHSPLLIMRYKKFVNIKSSNLSHNRAQAIRMLTFTVNEWLTAFNVLNNEDLS